MTCSDCKGEIQVRDDTTAAVGSKGRFSGDVWVKVEQRIPGHVPLSQSVAANIVCYGHYGQILLGVGVHRMYLVL